jgi:ketosteroid isomerase-like protein
MSGTIGQDIRDAIARLHRAMADVANGDVRAIKALYSHTPDATSFYGWGGYEKGWEAVNKRWDWAAQQFKGGTVSYEPLTVVASGDLFYTTDIETFHVAMDGMTQATGWSNRVTHIFRREAGTWRLIHRHGNRLEEQYRPGPRLTERDAAAGKG